MSRLQTFIAVALSPTTTQESASIAAAAPNGSSSAQNTYVYNGVIRQGGKTLVQRFVHLGCRALEKLAAALPTKGEKNDQLPSR